MECLPRVVGSNPGLTHGWLAPRCGRVALGGLRQTEWCPATGHQRVPLLRQKGTYGPPWPLTSCSLTLARNLHLIVLSPRFVPRKATPCTDSPRATHSVRCTGWPRAVRLVRACGVAGWCRGGRCCACPPVTDVTALEAARIINKYAAVQIADNCVNTEDSEALHTGVMTVRHLNKVCTSEDALHYGRRFNGDPTPRPPSNLQATARQGRAGQDRAAKIRAGQGRAGRAQGQGTPNPQMVSTPTSVPQQAIGLLAPIQTGTPILGTLSLPPPSQGNTLRGPQQVMLLH